MSKRFGLLYDVYYCTGCHSCEVACEQENGYEAGECGVKVTEHILNEKGKINIDYVPYMTNRCKLCMKRYVKGQKPACVKHCLANCIEFGTADELIEKAKDRSYKKPMIFLK